MASEPDERVDEKVREAFTTDEATATRMAERALSAPPRRSTSTPLRASLALAAVALCAGLTAWLSRPTIPAAIQGPSTRTGQSAQPPAAAEQPGVIELSGSFVDGVLIVPIPGENIVIAGPDGRSDRPREGYGIVFVEGGVR